MRLGVATVPAGRQLWSETTVSEPVGLEEAKIRDPGYGVDSINARKLNE